MPDIVTLKSKKDFKNCAIYGKSVRGNFLSVRFFNSGKDVPMFGFSIKKK